MTDSVDVVPDKNDLVLMNIGGRPVGVAAADFGGYAGSVPGAGSTYPASRLIDPEQWRTTGMSDDTLWSTAIAATAGDDTVVFNCNGARSFDINSAITVTDRTFRIRGNDTVFIQRANTAVFSLTNSFGTPLVVSAVDNTVSHDYSNIDGTSTPCAKITVVGTPPAVGAIGKIYSDDLLTGSDNVNNDEHRGEFVRIGYVSGQDIYTNFRLRDTYSTTVRFAELNRTNELEMDRVRCKGDAAGLAGGFSFGFILANGWFRPRFRLDGKDGYGALLQVQGCLQSEGIIRAIDLLNNPSANRFGYGVSSCSSENGHWRVMGARLRHAYTTNVNSTSAGDTRSYRYGRTRSDLIEGVGWGCDLAWDTHSDAEECIFNGVVAHGTFRGEGTAGSGGQLRGFRNRMVNPQFINTYLGMHFYSQFPGGSQDNEVINLHYTGNGQVVRVAGKVDDPVPMRCHVKGISGYTENGSPFQINYGDLRIRNNHIRPKSTANFSTLYAPQNGAILEVDGFDHDYTDHTGTSATLAHPSIAGASIKLRNGRIRNNTGTHAAWVDADTLDSGVIDIAGVVADAAPATSSGIKNPAVTPGFTSLGYVVGTTGASSAGRDGYMTLSMASGSNALDLGSRNSPVIEARLETTDATSFVNSITAGAFVGQVLLLYCRRVNSSSFGFMIAQNSGGLIDVGKRTMCAPGSVATLVWNGTVWSGGTSSGNNDAAISSDNGNANATISGYSAGVQLWNTAITAARAAILATDSTMPTGRRIRVVRGASATGAFNVDCRQASSGGTIIKSLTAAGQWADFIYDGTNWIETATGSL